MDSNIIYWIWLQQALGCGNGKFKKVISEFNDAKTFYELGDAVWKSCGILTKKELDKIRSCDFDDAKKIIEKCEFYNQNIITYNDNSYPERLRNIYNPPCVLYVKGDMVDVDDNILISIVGTRSAISENEEISYDFAYELSKSGVIIVSGGALGIDTMAHKGALDAGSKTVCVLGNGLDVNYPKENSSLRYDISQNGVLVSEYPPETPPLPRNFPIRNRILSALSLGTLVIQAGKKSGALITANLAAEQNRDVFAIPGSIKDEQSVGSNDLIKDGAKPVTCAMDIIEEYIGIYKDKLDFTDIVNNKTENKDNNSSKDKKIYSNVDTNIISRLSENAKKVYNVLGFEKEHIDDISVRAGLPINQVLQSITELEIYGVINSYSGKRYSKIT